MFTKWYHFTKSGKSFFRYPVEFVYWFQRNFLSGSKIVSELTKSQPRQRVQLNGLTLHIYYFIAMIIERLRHPAPWLSDWPCLWCEMWLLLNVLIKLLPGSFHCNNAGAEYCSQFAGILFLHQIPGRCSHMVRTICWRGGSELQLHPGIYSVSGGVLDWNWSSGRETEMSNSDSI